MKIIIPSEKGTLNSQICVSFGRAPYFILFDTESGSYEILNNGAAESQGGAGIKAAQIVADSGADTLITCRCGQNAADVLNAAKIEIYCARIASVNDIIQSFNNGELTLLTEFHSGFHNHGGGMK